MHSAQLAVQLKPPRIRTGLLKFRPRIRGSTCCRSSKENIQTMLKHLSTTNTACLVNLTYQAERHSSLSQRKT
uniref:Uncharacterized protein n=1 Tax=Hyaloperonospora arabidopsidis (strain Emoy2) TaxID=559515 RepID=M4BA14_HYAAE